MGEDAQPMPWAHSWVWPFIGPNLCDRD